MRRGEDKLEKYLLDQAAEETVRLGAKDDARLTRMIATDRYFLPILKVTMTLAWVAVLVCYLWRFRNLGGDSQALFHTIVSFAVSLCIAILLTIALVLRSLSADSRLIQARLADMTKTLNRLSKPS